MPEDLSKEICRLVHKVSTYDQLSYKFIQRIGCVMISILFLVISMMPGFFYASSEPVVSAVKQVASCSSRENSEALAKVIGHEVPCMPKELSLLISAYAQFAPLIIRNNLPESWAHVPSDSVMEVRFGNQCKAVAPGQSVNLMDQPDFPCELADQEPYAEIEISYPGSQNSVTNTVESKTLSWDSLNKGVEYVLELVADRLPMLMRSDNTLQSAQEHSNSFQKASAR